MKLVVAGATGFVGTEVVRQAIHHPSITSVIALGRRATTIPEPSPKFKSVECDNFSTWPDLVKEQLKGADACIWLLAITPAKSKALPWDQVRTICYDYTTTGIETLSEIANNSSSSNNNKPLRFVYASGANTVRDPAKKPWILGDYLLLRGNCEQKVLDFAAQSAGAVQSCVLKPGLIFGPGRDGLILRGFQAVLGILVGLPSLDVTDMAATALKLAIDGPTKDTFDNRDLIETAREARGEAASSQGPSD
ncbi:NAD(P)-binding domain protein [Moelleriella libera RCEF 2490]|uniref:NAD(P)-binding domain protein n=1 Tax=Moelleriella libera RCEF 2490 TaxID=1081109 RepID=A0A162IIH7_9HYPO|nr:NAD(P)-binding domain protein [Moelleriella libera RCEF 2490]